MLLKYGTMIAFESECMFQSDSKFFFRCILFTSAIGVFKKKTLYPAPVIAKRRTRGIFQNQSPRAVFGLHHLGAKRGQFRCEGARAEATGRPVPFARPWNAPSQPRADSAVTPVRELTSRRGYDFARCVFAMTTRGRSADTR